MKKLKQILLICLLAEKASLQAFEPNFSERKQTKSVIKQNGNSGIFNLNKVSSKTDTFRKVNVIRDDNYDVEISFLTKMKETIFGKSKETLFWENYQETFKKKINQLNKRNQILTSQGEPYTIVNVNGENYSYTIDLYCGSESVKMGVVFDTGSDWLILQSSQCQTCTGDMWDQTQSSTYQYLHKDGQLLYGSAAVLVSKSADQIYLDSSKAFGISNFTFALINSQRGISPLGGIIGFSRDYSGYHGPLFYEALYNETQISNKVFATYYAKDPTSCFTQIGDYDQSNTYYTGQMTWLPLVDNFFWMTKVTGMKYGTKTKKLKAQKVILDTGTSLAYIPKSPGKTLLGYILKGHQHFKYSGLYVVSCEDTWKSVFLKLGGYYIEIPPETYLLDFGDGICVLGFMLQSGKEWLLGDVLFQNYYNVWDHDNNRIGFALRTGSDATTEPFTV